MKTLERLHCPEALQTTHKTFTGAHFRLDRYVRMIIFVSGGKLSRRILYVLRDDPPLVPEQACVSFIHSHILVRNHRPVF